MINLTSIAEYGFEVVGRMPSFEKGISIEAVEAALAKIFNSIYSKAGWKFRRNGAFSAGNKSGRVVMKRAIDFEVAGDMFRTMMDISVDEEARPHHEYEASKSEWNLKIGESVLVTLYVDVKELDATHGKSVRHGRGSVEETIKIDVSTAVSFERARLTDKFIECVNDCIADIKSQEPKDWKPRFPSLGGEPEIEVEEGHDFD